MLTRTIQLVDEYLQQHPDVSERQLSIRLGYSDMALQMARKRDRLSPLVAGQLAEALGLDIGEWMVTATFEAEEKSDAARELRTKVASQQHRLPTRENLGFRAGQRPASTVPSA